MAQRIHNPQSLDALSRELEVASGTSVFGTQAGLAEFLNVHRSQISRVARGAQALREEQAWRLTALTAVCAALRHVLDPEAVPAWLRGANGHLGGRRPIDLLRDGRLAEVMDAVEAERAGVVA
jgi:hypothetical protein